MSRLARALAIVALLLPAPAGAQEDPWFAVKTLNAGLPAPSGVVDRRTPRGAVRTLLRAAEDGRWDDAAQVLDLADIAPDAQRVEGPIRARQLHSVIERRAVLDWTTLVARPDALRVLGGQSQAQAGEPRRSLLIDELPLDPVPASIRLERVRAGEDSDPVWVFSRETVADLPALYRAYGPSPLEARLPPVLLEEGPFGLMWWEWIGLPVLAAAAASIAWAMRRAIDRLRRATANPLARAIVRAVSMPAILGAVTTLVVFVSENVFVFSGRIDAVLTPMIAIGYVTAVLLLIVNGVEAILDNMIAPGADVDLTDAERQDARVNATRLNAWKRILTVVVFVVGVGIVLSSANVFRGLGLSLLASAGALTVVLGFAARRVLGNVMASLQIAMNRSARVGDRVVYKGELCYVERINMTFVQLRDWDDTRLIVPVEEFAYETFSNWTIQDPKMARILKFKLTPRTDVARAREIFMAIMADLSADAEMAEAVGDLDDAAAYVTGQDVFGLDVWFKVPCTSPNTSWTVACEARERLVVRLRALEEETGEPIFPEATPAEAA